MTSGVRGSGKKNIHKELTTNLQKAISSTRKIKRIGHVLNMPMVWGDRHINESLLNH